MGPISNNKEPVSPKAMQQRSNARENRLPKTIKRDFVEQEASPQPSVWNSTYEWVSSLAKGLGGLLSHTLFSPIDYEQSAPTPYAKPDAVIAYIRQLKAGNLSDKDMARLLNKVSTHAAANKEIEKAYLSAVELIEDPVWENVAYTHLEVQKDAFPLQQRIKEKTLKTRPH